MTKGKLIVFEGIDGSGKTTQIKAITKWLESIGQLPLAAKEPGDTRLGVYLSSILTGRCENFDMCPEAELFLFAADRVQHVKEVIAPALAQGKVVLCDRYTASTVAYQSYGRGIKRSVVNQVNKISTGGLLPDLTIYLDLDVEIALGRIALRGKGDRFDEENVAFYQKVRTGYLNSRCSTDLVLVRADRSIEVVTQEIIYAIKERFSW